MMDIAIAAVFLLFTLLGWKRGLFRSLAELAAMALALLLASLFFALGHASFGMLMGLTYPKLDAVNEAVVIKQSLAVTLSMFVPMAAIGAAGGLYWLGGKLTPWVAIALPLALLALLAAASTAALAKQGPSLLRAL